MNELFNKVIIRLIPFMESKQFSLKSKNNKFIKKTSSPQKKEEYIALSYIASKNISGLISINALAGIYFPDVRAIEKKIENDFINKYPLISGSISHFSSTDKSLSIPIKTETDLDNAIGVLIQEIENGAFYLFNSYNTLRDFFEGIKRKDPILYQYYKFYDQRKFITVACIVYTLDGLQSTIRWINENIKEQSKKEDLIVKFTALG